MSAEIQGDFQLPNRNARPHHNRVAAQGSAFDTYSTNRLCVIIDGKQTWFEAGPSTPSAGDESDTGPRADAPVAAVLDGNTLTYISAWNPDGAPTTFDRNRALHADLVAFVTRLGIEFMDAVTVAPGHGWFEQGLVLVNVSEDMAHDLAWKYDQEGWIHIDTLWHSRPRYRVGSPQDLPLRLLTQDDAPCPLQPFDSDSKVCKPVGGPWGSAAMQARAMWAEHQRVATALLGCGACGRARGQADLQSPIIYLREVHVASRHGGYSTGGHRSDYKWSTFARVLKDETAASDVDATAKESHDNETGEK